MHVCVKYLLPGDCATVPANIISSWCELAVGQRSDLGEKLERGRDFIRGEVKNRLPMSAGNDEARADENRLIAPEKNTEIVRKDNARRVNPVRAEWTSAMSHVDIFLVKEAFQHQSITSTLVTHDRTKGGRAIVHGCRRGRIEKHGSVIPSTLERRPIGAEGISR